MSQEAFPLRHRGVHVPYHLRRLELVSSGGNPRLRGGGGGSIHPRASPPVDELELQFGAFFGNLSVWVDYTMKHAAAHAGFDKIHLYTTVLRVLVDDITPHDELQRVVENIEAYVAYLSSSPDEEAPLSVEAQPRRPPPVARPLPPLNVTSPRKGVLSPRVMRAMAKDVAQDAALSSPRITSKPPKKIIELSDHEEAILEIALFYSEVVAQLEGVRAGAKKSDKHIAQPPLTKQWLQFPMEKRTQVLKTIKAKISKQTLFSSSVGVGSTTITATPVTPSTPRPVTNSIGHPRAVQQVKIASYFSLLALCLQETTRRISVFSAEIAAFVWRDVVYDTLDGIETILNQVLERQRRADDELQQLKETRSHIHDEISTCEREIQRLQSQNMRSLGVWDLEKQEMDLLEQEEAWHGHCKSLILKSVLALRSEVCQATWLHLSATSAQEGEEQKTNDTPTHQQLASVNYRRLPLGAALLQSKLRARVVYITHLIVLCRSFLHLHEKCALREVMEATSNNPRWSNPVPFEAAQPDIYETTLTRPQTSPMERISAKELLALKEINGVLRAIEELYVSSGGSGDCSSILTPIVTSGCDATTQFPAIGSTDLTALRSSSTTGRFTNAPAIVGAGSSHSKRRNGHMIAGALPVGSGRRRGIVIANLQEDDSQHDPQPLIRLDKAIAKLPRHFIDVLILPLLQTEPFPPDQATSVVESLTKAEILARIQWIYASVLEATLSSSTSSPPVTSVPTGSNRSNQTVDMAKSTPVPLARHRWKAWKSDQLVAFVHSAFLSKYDNDVTKAEHEFVRFIASIQLLFSGLSTALNLTTSGSSPSQVMEKIHFFTRLTRLFQLEAPDKITQNRLPAQLFSIFFYSMHVLQQVAVTKKQVEEEGLTLDVWTIAAAATTSGSVDRVRAPPLSLSPRSKSRRVAQQSEFRSHAVHAGQFVLLESVKTLLMYLLESTSPDASVVVDEWSTFLSDCATLAKVALLSPITPGAYGISHSQHPTQSQSTTTATTATTTTSTPSVANGELTDALILPLDFVVHTIATIWLQQHRALVDRLSVAMRAASVSSSGELSFDEFTHVMVLGSASGPQASSSIRTGQLTQIYASLVAKQSRQSGQNPNRDGGVSWRELLVAVIDEIDLLGVTDRLRNVVFRSIQQALIRGSRGVGGSPWALKPAYRGGDLTTLRRTWDASRLAMREGFAQALQRDNVVEGFSLWQTGLERIDRVEKLFHDGRARHLRTHSRARMRRRSVVVVGTLDRDCTAANDDDAMAMNSDELAVAWRALYYLQLDHAQAHHVA